MRKALTIALFAVMFLSGIVYLIATPTMKCGEVRDWKIEHSLCQILLWDPVNERYEIAHVRPEEAMKLPYVKTICVEHYQITDSH